MNGLRVVGALTIVALMGLPSTAFAVGELTQKAGTAGCISDTGSSGTCQDGLALAGVGDVLVSADGLNVYSGTYGAGAVGVFGRSAGGGLTQLGCGSFDTTGALCAPTVETKGVSGLAFSPAGENLYVAGDIANTVTAFNRLGGGLLAQKAPPDGCFTIAPAPAGCASGGRALDPYGVAVSGGGTNVYVASYSSGGGGIATLGRSPSGVLSQVASDAGCVTNDGSGGDCINGRGMGGGRAVAVSPDGANVYGAFDTPGSVAVLTRDANGVLGQPGGAAGCINDGANLESCGIGKGLGQANDVFVSPDNKNVYVVSHQPGGIATFTRGAGGALNQTGCITYDGSGPCVDGRGLLFARNGTISRDGRSVYVTSQSLAGAIAVFDRDPATGALTQKAGTAGCLGDTTEGCAPAREMSNTLGVTVAPDGRNVYTASSGGGISVFDRVPLPSSAGDTTKPVVSAVKLSRRTFRVASAPTAVSARKKRKRPGRGTTISYSVSEGATATLLIERKFKGRKVRKGKGKKAKTRCVKETRKNKRGRRKCTLYKKAGTLTRKAKAGKNSVKFSGRIGKKKLAAGSYRLTITAKDAAGNRSKSRTATFKIVR